MKTYLNDEKTPVDPWLVYDIFQELKALCAIVVFCVVCTCPIGLSPLLRRTDRNFVDNFLQVVIYLAFVANILHET